MKFRKPELIPLLFIIGALFTLVTLGSWQLQRLQWKNTLLGQIEQSQSQPALGDLPMVLEGIDYRKVMLTGRFLNDKILYVVGGKQGEPPGFFIFTPFKLDDDGRVILVNRGFAPKGKENSKQGTQTVEGVIRPARGKRTFAPKNHPEKNLWFYEDIAAMSALTREQLLPMVVEQIGERKRGIYPIVSDGKISLRNDHFGYAVIWFSLAIIGLIMFAFYQREKESA